MIETIQKPAGMTSAVAVATSKVVNGKEYRLVRPVVFKGKKYILADKSSDINYLSMMTFSGNKYGEIKTYKIDGREYVFIRKVIKKKSVIHNILARKAASISRANPLRQTLIEFVKINRPKPGDSRQFVLAKAVIRGSATKYWSEIRRVFGTYHDDLIEGARIIIASMKNVLTPVGSGVAPVALRPYPASLCPTCIKVPTQAMPGATIAKPYAPKKLVVSLQPIVDTVKQPLTIVSPITAPSVVIQKQIEPIPVIKEDSPAAPGVDTEETIDVTEPMTQEEVQTKFKIPVVAWIGFAVLGLYLITKK